MYFVRDFIGRDLCFHKCECCDIGEHRILPPGDRIFENQDLVIYTNISVPMLGFIVVAPKKHVSRFSELEMIVQISLLTISSEIVEKMKELGVADEFTVLKMEGDGIDHCKIWILPKLDGIFENGFDFSLLENRYSMERRKIPVSEPYDILFLNTRLKEHFKKRKFLME